MNVKKTQSKAFANLIVSLLLFALEIFAWTQTNIIKTIKSAAVHPNVFPRIMIIGMAVFTLVLFVQSIIKLIVMNPNDPMAGKSETICPFNKKMFTDIIDKIVYRSMGRLGVSVDTAKEPQSERTTNHGVLAALFVILLCAGYVYFFKDLGYVVVSIVISAIIMWLIGTRNPVQLALIAILVPLMMWLLFYKLLQVNIPMGILQFLRDLVDKIKI